MQQKIDLFNQTQADFSAGLHQLDALNKEIDRQSKIVLALDSEISELEAQGKETNGHDLPDSDNFMKFYAKNGKYVKNAQVYVNSFNSCNTTAKN